MVDEKQERTEKEPWAWTAWQGRQVCGERHTVGGDRGMLTEQILGPTEYGVAVRLPNGEERVVFLDADSATAVHGVLSHMLEEKLRLKSDLENLQKESAAFAASDAHNLEVAKNLRKALEQDEEGMLALRAKYDALANETTGAWIARLHAKALAAQDLEALRNQAPDHQLLADMSTRLCIVRRRVAGLEKERGQVAEYLGGDPDEDLIPLVKRAVEELQQLREQLRAPGKGLKMLTGCPLDQVNNRECRGDKCSWYIPSARGAGQMECAVASLGKQARNLVPLACEVLELLRAHLRAKG